MRLLISTLAVLLLVESTGSQTITLTEQYRDVAGRLLGAALVDEDGWKKLSHVTTHIGHRLSGSPQLEEALRWISERMKADGLDNVRLQPVKVPHWVRGEESARMTAPFKKPLAMLGFGSSVGTPRDGITASVIVVSSFEELDALGSTKVAGKIVVYDVNSKQYTSIYRNNGAARAAKHGAVAVLVRSTTESSLYTPHTGNQDYVEGIKKIPAAGITIEDAALIRRLVESGEDVKVSLKMEAKTLPDADSANVMGEIIGTGSPNEVVVLGGHIDSWDVGQGAHDDLGGVIAAWQAVVLMRQLGLKPRRTVRAVGWTNEENGARGGQMYRDVLGAEKRHVAAIEMDDGSERPLGFRFSLRDAAPESSSFLRARLKLEEIVQLLAGIGVNAIVSGSAGTDVGPLTQDGIPSLGLFTTGEHYFEWHHSHADTLDKIDPQDFRRCIASLAVTAFILADMPGELSH